ncbi:vacuolar protein sorting-associated protein 26C isoform X1 [Monodelphis domestica]|uniref:vacuolar protein sorting-associated protein 26C isoform X1 n=1 Tax=Monodelphis domestica TaxID=13616 RepID=UPI0004434B78|nr:vacuolar protein sorting-associated protein 26C isoform X1 [Monodelphis domestica]
MGTVLDIKIKRANKVYYAGEMLSGVVVISSKDSVQHQGVLLTMEGLVNLQLSAKSVGMFEAFCNSVKPIQVLNSSIEIVKPGKFPSGKTEIPFEFPLHVKGNKVLYETYHGVFVNIQYTLRCDLKRSLLAKDLTKICEFIVHSTPQKGKATPSPVDFTITPDTLQNVRERASLPKFLIRGHLSSTNCVITQPLTGELLVEYSEAAIKNIELQLVRVETCGMFSFPKVARKATPGTPPRSRTFRLRTATSAGVCLCPSTWSFPDSSRAPLWKRPISKSNLKLILWSCFMMITSSQRISH